MSMKYALILVAALALSCNRSDDGPRPAAPQTPVPPRALSEDAKKIRAILDGGPGTCNTAGGFKDCETRVVKAWSKPANAPRAKQRVLIVDTYSAPESAFGINRDRLLAVHYQIAEGKAQYGVYSPEATAPLLLDEVLGAMKAVTSFRDLESVAIDLRRLHHPIQVLAEPKPWSDNHGEQIFDWMARWNPDAEFVIAQFPVLTQAMTCALDSKDGRARHAELYARVADELRMLIANYGIDFVNISWEPATAKLAQRFAECGKNYGAISFEDRMEIANGPARLIEAMSDANPELLIARAVPNTSPIQLERNAPLDPFNCKDYPRAIAVGFFSRMDGDVPADGAPINPAWVHRVQRNAIGCADTFINGGFIDDENAAHDFDEPLKSDEHSLKRLLFGFEFIPTSRMATSWATPMALSVMMKWKLEDPSLSPEQLKLKISGKMWEPIRNGGFSRGF